jgi:hypothetical protein
MSAKVLMIFQIKKWNDKCHPRQSCTLVLTGYIIYGGGGIIIWCVVNFCIMNCFNTLIVAKSKT